MSVLGVLLGMVYDQKQTRDRVTIGEGVNEGSCYSLVWIMNIARNVPSGR